jgi:pectinesterase
MIRNMTDTDIANELQNTNRKLKEEKEGNERVWPEWMSVADRRLLQSSSVTPNVVVAADGSGDYKTVSEAVAAVPKKSSTRYVIQIKAGVYRENVEVPKDKHNVMFLGDGRKTTIITASRNVVDGSTTFKSATVGKSILTLSFSILFYFSVCNYDSNESLPLHLFSIKRVGSQNNY